MEHKQIIELLDYIDPAACDYTQWVQVGMSLKEEGLDVSVWDNWSKRDERRYHDGECAKKWNTFQSTGVTAGTIYQFAVDSGWQPFEGGHELAWDDVITKDDYTIIDKNWVEGQEIQEPSDTEWNPSKEIIKYLETLFESNENVGYVTATYQKVDDKTGEIKHIPTSGSFDKTAGQLIQELGKYQNDIGAVFGDYKEEAGAWIRFNPLDGKGIKNSNVVDYRYALVESDNMDLDKQNAIIRQLELPVACLVFSGKKSIHAIVKIHASCEDEYKKRVDYLYKVCQKNGLSIDIQNRNPSRLSRLPGVKRNGRKQFLIDTNIGKASWDEWFEWIEGINDDLPEPEGLDQFWDNMPTLAEPLIDGVLRQGHKMLLVGPSKAGKSYALIELCIAIAEGKKWLGWNCAKGKIMYVNLELDRASCLHRFKDVYQSMKIAPNNLSNIDIWNLRGKSVPMDKLAPKLIRRAQKKDYIAIIIDPIYKVITGDENSADQMAHFCNQFDKVASNLGAAVIYCHHHSKGAQGGKKSMDRASGSGVFSRDPDALIDLVELELTENFNKYEVNKITAETIAEYFKIHKRDFYDTMIGDDDRLSKVIMETYAEENLSALQLGELDDLIASNLNKIKQKTAWRVEGTLREFPKFEPKNLWFQYPIHVVDEVGILQDMDAEGDKPFWQKGKEKRKKNADKKKKKLNDSFVEAIEHLTNFNEKPPTKKEVAEYLGKSERTIERRLEETEDYIFDTETGTIKPK